MHVPIGAVSDSALVVADVADGNLHGCATHMQRFYILVNVEGEARRS
jgi:hypothetical protein